MICRYGVSRTNTDGLDGNPSYFGTPITAPGGGNGGGQTRYGEGTSRWTSGGGSGGGGGTAGGTGWYPGPGCLKTIILVEVVHMVILVVLVAGSS